MEDDDDEVSYVQKKLETWMNMFEQVIKENANVEIKPLPDEVIRNILYRLPPTELGALAAYLKNNKLWADDIRDHLRFPSAHLVVMRSTLGELKFEMISVVPHSLPVIGSIWQQIDWSTQLAPVHPMSSSDGLLLLKHKSELYVFNPYNTFLHKVVHNGLSSIRDLDGERGMVLAFDRIESETRFRIVHVSVKHLKGLPERIPIYNIRVYQRKRWATQYVRMVERYQTNDDHTNGVYWKGCVYWPQFHRNKVACYNISTNLYYDIYLPEEEEIRDERLKKVPYVLFRTNGKLLAVKATTTVAAGLHVYEFNPPQTMEHHWELTHENHWELKFRVQIESQNVGFHHILSVVCREPGESYILFAYGLRKVWKQMIPSGGCTLVHEFRDSVNVPLKVFDFVTLT